MERWLLHAIGVGVGWPHRGGDGTGRDGTGCSTVQPKVKGPTVVVTTNVGNASHPILVADTQPTRYVGR